MKPTDQQFFVNGYHLAALEWHAGARHRVIACHGWLDNAASFHRLAPLLDQCHLVALDLSGHGHSDHKSLQATYNVWDDLLDILAVADSLGWPQFHLLGHSRGAIMNMMLAAAMPQRIKSLIMLDGLLPQPTPISATAEQLGKFLRDYSKPQKPKQHPGFATLEDAVKVRRRAIGMSEESARPIVERGLIEREGRLYWRSDPRLLNASAFKMSHEHNQAIIDALQVPNLLLVTEEGVSSFPYFGELTAANPKIQRRALAGSHHFHMEAPAEEVAEYVREFIAANA